MFHMSSRKKLCRFFLSTLQGQRRATRLPSSKLSPKYYLVAAFPSFEGADIAQTYLYVHILFQVASLRQPDGIHPRLVRNGHPLTLDRLQQTEGRELQARNPPIVLPFKLSATRRATRRSANLGSCIQAAS